MESKINAEVGQNTPTTNRSSIHKLLKAVGAAAAAFLLLREAYNNDSNPTAPSVPVNGAEPRGSTFNQFIFVPPETDAERDFEPYVTPSNDNAPDEETLPEDSVQNPETIEQENGTPPPLVTTDKKISPEHERTSVEGNGTPPSTVSPDDNNKKAPKVTPENHRPARAND